MQAYWRLIRTLTWKTVLTVFVAVPMMLWTVYGIHLVLFDLLQYRRGSAITFTVLFYMLAVSSVGTFYSSDLINMLKKTEKKMSEDGVRAGLFHETLLNQIAEAMAGSVVIAVLALECFWIACHAWAAVDPGIFTTRATSSAINYYILDLVMKGAFFDWMEHFKVSVTRLEAAPHNEFVQLTFRFRLFISLVAIGTVAKLIGLYKVVFALPEHKPLLAKLARNLAPKA